MYTYSKYNTTQNLTIKLKHTFEADRCNLHYLVGDFEKVLAGAAKKPESEVEVKVGSSIERFPITPAKAQKYIAYFAVMSTLAADCPNKGKKVLNLESKALTLEPIEGRLSVYILVPDGFEIVISKNE
jgi:hypothetical protein